MHTATSALVQRCRKHRVCAGHSECQGAVRRTVSGVTVSAVKSGSASIGAEEGAAWLEDTALAAGLGAGFGFFTMLKKFEMDLCPAIGPGRVGGWV